MIAASATLPLDGLDWAAQIMPFKLQLLKWVGNKQRFAHEIISYFPQSYGTYFEPFLGSGAVLGTLAPERAVASDCFGSLIGIWQTLQSDPELLIQWYRERYKNSIRGEKVAEYEKVKSSYNQQPNSADLLFLSRSCYGGVVRFRASDGWMSTPCGVHDPIPVASFAERVQKWKIRTSGATFLHSDYLQAFDMAQQDDLIYCDPPYSHSQSILYGAQKFRLEELFEAISHAKSRGVRLALSIDGTKKSGDISCDLQIPDGLFEREESVNCGRSMLKRFQRAGSNVKNEGVSDRLLLTY